MTGVGRSKLTRGRPRSTLPLVSSPAPRIPPRVLAEVLIANKYTCCICVQARRPTKVHSIVGDPTNTKLNNLAVICTGCLERVVREGATDKRFGAEGLRHFKKRWEEVCAVNADIFEDEPVFVSNRTIDVKAKDCGATYPIDLERGHLLLASVEADVPVTVLLVPENNGSEKALVVILDRRSAEVSYVAPRGGMFTVWVENHGDQDAVAEVSVVVWPAEGERDDQAESEGETRREYLN